MTAFQFSPAKREGVGLLLGFAGGTGSGKTMSALRVAKGLAGDKPFAVIDTEAGRAKHYADRFQFDHGDLTPPFSPERYAEAIQAADSGGYPVIVVDSASHEYAGEGGILDMQEAEFERMGRRDAVKMASWIKPKMEHKRLVSRLLQVRAHLILCFRAEEKIEIVKANGKTEIRPKQTLTGLNGWVPITERNLPFELTLSFLLTMDAPGVPKPIKLPEPLRPLIPLDCPLTEDVGVELARWATGTKTGEADDETAHKATAIAADLLDLATQLGKRDEVASKIASNRRVHADELDKHVTWLKRSITAGRKQLAERDKEAEQLAV